MPQALNSDCSEQLYMLFMFTINSHKYDKFVIGFYYNVCYCFLYSDPHPLWPALFVWVVVCLMLIKIPSVGVSGAFYKICHCMNCMILMSLSVWSF